MLFCTKTCTLRVFFIKHPFICPFQIALRCMGSAGTGQRKFGRTQRPPKASRVHFLYPARGAFATCTDCGPGHVPHEKQLSSLPRRRFRSLRPGVLPRANWAEPDTCRKPRGSIFSIRHAALSQHVPIAAQCMFRMKNSSLRCRAAVSGHSTPEFCRAQSGRTRHLPKASQVHFLCTARGAFPTCTDCGPGHVPHEKQLSQQMPRELSSLKIRFRTQTPP